MAVNRLHESRFAPWAALAAASLAAALNHQVLSDMLRFDCRLGDPAHGLAVGAGDLLLMALGVWISWASVRGRGEAGPHESTRRFIAKLGVAFAALLAVMVVWQVLATFLVPACPD